MTPLEQSRLTTAFAFALECHAEQTRKGPGGAPYATHLMHVAALVLEFGGDIEQAMGALLHDSIEDCVAVDDDLLRESFGDGVAAIVRDCTDTEPGEDPAHKRPWKLRKAQYVEHLRHAPERSLLVAVCDKLHNLDSMIAGIEEETQEKFFGRFKGGPQQQLWYYQQVEEAIEGRIPPRLARELHARIARFEALLAD